MIQFDYGKTYSDEDSRDSSRCLLHKSRNQGTQHALSHIYNNNTNHKHNCRSRYAYSTSIYLQHTKQPNKRRKKKQLNLIGLLSKSWF